MAQPSINTPIPPPTPSLPFTNNRGPDNKPAGQGFLAPTAIQFLQYLWTAVQGPNSIGAPSGMISAFGGPTVPNGWLLCDGAEYERNLYVNLFQAIGTSWGAGDGVDTFNVPDLRGRTLIGASGSIPFGSTGGSTQVTLTIPNLPSHDHAITDPGHTHVIDDPGHNHAITDPGHSHGAVAMADELSIGTDDGSAVPANTTTETTGITVNTNTTGVSADSATVGFTGTDPTGSGDPIDILPPYAATLMMIKF